MCLLNIIYHYYYGYEMQLEHSTHRKGVESPSENII